MTAEEDDEDMRNINIPEEEGHYKVEGLQIENPEITAPLKTRQVNIGIEAEPKFAKIGDYWDDTMVDKVAELLHEYLDLFPTRFSDMKGIIGDLGIVNITLKPDMKLIKQRPYRLNPKHKKRSA